MLLTMGVTLAVVKSLGPRPSENGAHSQLKALGGANRWIYVRSCWVRGVKDVVASAKICDRLLGVSFFTRALASASATGAAKAEMALSAKVAKMAKGLNNIMCSGWKGLFGRRGEVREVVPCKRRNATACQDEDLSLITPPLLYRREGLHRSKVQ